MVESVLREAAMNQLTVKSHFSSAHLYHQPLWSDKKNREVFGRCFTEHGHGHNYTLEVTFTASIENILVQVQRKQNLLDGLTKILDHEHLNFVIPEFKNKVPTTENIALYFSSKLKNEKVIQLRVYEMTDLWAELNLPEQI